MKKVYKGIVAGVTAESIAAELGIEEGDALLEINGMPMRDIIDVSFASAADELELTIEKADGTVDVWDIEKDEDEQLGIEFREAVFDGVRLCANSCIFCFVEQMPRDCRNSLYIKDDDYRLSFLYGNFITMTNLVHDDLKRIKEQRLSPLYVSVHATDAAVREKMLGLKRAGQVLDDLERLWSAGVQIHAQVVLCSGWNDGEVLRQTINDLAARNEQVLSLAVVPVGLTAYRKDLYELQVIDRLKATEVVEMVESMQAEFRRTLGRSFVHLADEFYIMAERDFPVADCYDGFPQIENGIGLTSEFMETWDNVPISESLIVPDADSVSEEKKIVITGEAFAPILRKLINSADEIKDKTGIYVLAIKNRFFAGGVNVAGLLTGTDIVEQLEDYMQQNLSSLNRENVEVIVPSLLLRKGETMMLDGMTIEEMQTVLRVKIMVAEDAYELKNILMKECG